MRTSSRWILPVTQALVSRGDHVDFAADAELRQIDAGLDRETGVGQEAALVVGFQVVEVRAGAVNLVGDVVAGAVGEVLGEAGGANYGAGGIVGLEAADGAVLGEGLLDGGDGGVAGVADGFKDVLLVRAWARGRRRRSR